MESIDIGGLVSIGGWGGIVAFGVWLIFTGRLIPRSVVDKILQQAGDDVQKWRTAYDRSELARAKDREATMRALEGTQTAVHVIKALNDVVLPEKTGDDS